MGWNACKIGKVSQIFQQTGISICVAMSLHNLFLRYPHLSHYVESQILLSYKKILPVRSFGIHSSATYSFYPLHNSAEFYLYPAIAFHQKQKCPQHIHHLTLGLNLTTIFSLRYKIHNCNNLLLI